MVSQCLPQGPASPLSGGWGMRGSQYDVKEETQSECAIHTSEMKGRGH